MDLNVGGIRENTKKKKKNWNGRNAVSTSNVGMWTQGSQNKLRHTESVRRQVICNWDWKYQKQWLNHPERMYSYYPLKLLPEEIGDGHINGGENILIKK